MFKKTIQAILITSLLYIFEGTEVSRSIRFSFSLFMDPPIKLTKINRIIIEDIL